MPVFHSPSFPSVVREAGVSFAFNHVAQAAQAQPLMSASGRKRTLAVVQEYYGLLIYVPEEAQSS